MDFYKLDNERLIKYRQPLRTKERDIFTTNADTLAKYGYYPLRCTDAPEVDEHHAAVPHWEQGENEIVQVWIVEEIPETDEIPDNEALAIIAEGAE